MTRRRVSDEERALLEQAMRAVKPISRRGQAAQRAKPVHSAAKAAGHSPEKIQPKVERAPAARPQPRKPAPSISHMAIDRHTEQKLRRGRIEIDATLDLHGMTQSAAHRRLNTFIARASDDGHRRVLVITGKGGTRGGDESIMPSDRRGVLREAVPRWIAEPPLADLVWGLKPAGPRHGGPGALYVLLKKQR